MEYLLFIFYRLLFLKSENPRQVVSGLPAGGVRIVFDHKIHLCVADECLVEMETFVLEKTVQRKLCYDVSGPEECVDLYTSRIDRILYRISVKDKNVFQDKGCKRFQVDLFEADVSIDLVRYGMDNLVCNICLNLRELYQKCCRKEYADD